MSERSELCAVPSFREERREPAGAARRIASGRVFFWLLFFAQAKKSDSLLRSRSESFCFQALAVASASKRRTNATAKAFAPLSGERATFLCSCKEKVAKRSAFPTAEWLVKHALPPRPTRYARRVHSAAAEGNPASQKPEQNHEQRPPPQPSPALCAREGDSNSRRLLFPFSHREKVAQSAG